MALKLSVGARRKSGVMFPEGDSCKSETHGRGNLAGRSKIRKLGIPPGEFPRIRRVGMPRGDNGTSRPLQARSTDHQNWKGGKYL